MLINRSFFMISWRLKLGVIYRQHRPGLHDLWLTRPTRGAQVFVNARHTALCRRRYTSGVGVFVGPIANRYACPHLLLDLLLSRMRWGCCTNFMAICIDLSRMMRCFLSNLSESSSRFVSTLRWRLTRHMGKLFLMSGCTCRNRCSHTTNYI